MLTGPVSAAVTLEQLKQQEGGSLRHKVVAHNCRIAYVIVAVKDNGLKVEFAEVTKNVSLQPMLPTGNQVDLEITSDEDAFR